MGSSGVTIQGDIPVTLWSQSDLLWIVEVLHPVSKDIGVCPTPLKGWELHHRNESCKIMDFSFGVLTMHQTREIEQLGSLYS